MNKRILFAILAIAFLAGAILRWMAGSVSYGLMLCSSRCSAAGSVLNQVKTEPIKNINVRNWLPE